MNALTTKMIHDPIDGNGGTSTNPRIIAKTIDAAGAAGTGGTSVSFASSASSNEKGASVGNPPGSGASLPAAADHQILCGIYHGACKEFKVIQQANVAPQLGKYLHDIIPRDSRTIADKNKGLFFRKIIKLCNSYLDYLNMIGEAVTGDMNTIGTVLKSPCISRVFC